MSEWILSLETEHRKNRLATTGMKTLGDHLGSIRCSSCLRFQLFGVETFLLFPECQGDGRDLARQCKTSHLRLHALGEQSRMKSWRGPLRQLALIAALLKIPFISWWWFRFSPRSC